MLYLELDAIRGGIDVLQTSLVIYIFAILSLFAFELEEPIIGI